MFRNVWRGIVLMPFVNKHVKLSYPDPSITLSERKTKAGTININGRLLDKIFIPPS